MWDLNTLHRINQKAAQQAREGKPERDALFLVTRITDPTKPFLLLERDEDVSEVVTVGQSLAEAA